MVTGDPTQLGRARADLEDVVKMGEKSKEYKLVYVVVSSKQPRITLKEALLVPIVVPELDTIYDALYRAEETIKGEETERPLFGPLMIRQRIDLKGLLLKRIATVATRQLTSIISPSTRTQQYDVTVYNLVREDCRKLNGKTRTDWTKAPSLARVFGRRLRRAEDVNKAVEEVNERIKGSGLKLDVRGSYVFCVEEGGAGWWQAAEASREHSTTTLS
ncbi:hypothetical protein IG193_08835 [Infirmifilum lucidum]|uniref:Uncharacterized protein n=1 Tax=Infirmifilum lucidum TaxID=2776706 RepID=A0A7L9FJ64_9CREN|nr:hypothetical protein [Infirmifilum lucidum]QOJ78835.1 hypothetical protein IG193_08835 [Infirmifilum lucidum]